MPAKPGQQPQPTPPPPQVQLPTTPHPNPMTPSPAQPSPAPSDHGGPQLPPPPAPPEGGSHDQEQAISAIMASLIKDSAQFEKDKSILQPPTTPTQPPLLSPSAAAGGSSLSATAAMLPTCPVPPASLAGATSVVKAVGTTTAAAAGNSSGGNATATGLKLVNRVSLQTLLSTPVVQQQQPAVASPSPTKVSTPLSAALSRPPVVSLPPTYTQALQAQQQQQQPVAIAAANRPRIVQQQQPHQQPSLVRRSLSGSEQPKPSLSQDAPGLQALLANAPSADSVGNNNETSSNAPTPSLLERLVTGQPVSSPAATPVRAVSTQSTSQVGGNLVQTSPCADSTQEITLAAILAKPPSSVGSASSPSPTKASPLLQQLQQPVQQSPRGQQQQPQLQQSIVSPLRQHQQLQQPQLSPASSTRSQPSPRMIQPSPSPRPAGSFAMPPQSPKQHQQLMQPPGSQLQASVRPQPPSILSATLQQQQQQQPIMTLPVQDLVAVSQPQANGILNGGQPQQAPQPQNVVSLQNLLQSGMVQVSTSSVTMQPGSSTTGNNMVLQIPGLADPVTLSVNMPQQQQATLQPKQQMPPMVTTAVKFTSPQTVVLQQAGASGTNSFIQLPQQPTAAAAAGLKQPATVVSQAGKVLQVQHRQQPQQQVFVNLQPGQQVVGPAGPGGGQGQPIQIVRTVRGPGGPGQQAGTTMQLQLNSAALKSPQQQQQGDHPQQLPPPIQSPSPSGSSLTSPPDGSAAVVLSDPQPKNGNLGKVRQQRKQSLK